MTPDYRVKKLLTEAKLDFKRLQNNVFFYCNYAKHKNSQNYKYFFTYN